MGPWFGIIAGGTETATKEEAAFDNSNACPASAHHSILNTEWHVQKTQNKEKKGFTTTTYNNVDHEQNLNSDSFKLQLQVGRLYLYPKGGNSFPSRSSPSRLRLHVQFYAVRQAEPETWSGRRQ